MSSNAQSQLKSNYQFWLLSIFLALVFVAGGSSHTDVQSLAILRPISIVFFAIALVTFNTGHASKHRAVFVVFGAMAVLTILYLVPLPPQIISLFQTTDLVRNIFGKIGATNDWHPISTVPNESLDTLFALATPLAVLFMAVQLSDRDKDRLLLLLIGLSCLSGVMGILQLLSSPTGPLYFYDITHSGSAVGLFANRNHSATLLACVFPMVAAYAATQPGRSSNINSRKMFAAAIAMVILPLIIVTGSRSGLITAIIGFTGAIFLWPKSDFKIKAGAKKPSYQKYQVLIFGVSIFIALSLVTVLFSRGFALERLVTEIPGQDGRKDFVIVSFEIFQKYFFWGGGPGSFASVYKIYEPEILLDSTFLNRAHNDYIETLVTFGVTSFPFFLFCALYFVWKSISHWRAEKRYAASALFGKMASLTIGMIAVASVSDYPLRTPTIMSVLVIFILWLSGSTVDDMASRPSNLSKQRASRNPPGLPSEHV